MFCSGRDRDTGSEVERENKSKYLILMEDHKKWTLMYRKTSQYTESPDLFLRHIQNKSYDSTATIRTSYREYCFSAFIHLVNHDMPNANYYFRATSQASGMKDLITSNRAFR